MVPRRTIASERVLEAEHNAFGALRLLFASFVIVSHSWVLGGHGTEPLVESSGISLGYLGVCAFFALSGALVGASAERTPTSTFLWHRARRVLPAYWVCLVVTAFGLGALIAHLQDLPPARALATPDAGSATSFVVNNFPLRFVQFGVGYVLAKLPYSTSINGSLWSLPHEFVCYLAILLVVRAWFASGRRTLVPLGLLAVSAGVAAAARANSAREVLPLGPFGPLEMEDLALLWTIFLLGACLAFHRERVPFAPRSVALAGGLLLLSIPLGGLVPFGLLLLPYVVLGLGRYLPTALRPVGRRTDLSYGLYLYGFPVGQAIVASGKLQASGAALAAWTLAFSLPLAALSWFLVERHFLRGRARDGAAPRPALESP